MIFLLLQLCINYRSVQGVILLMCRNTSTDSTGDRIVDKGRLESVAKTTLLILLLLLWLNCHKNTKSYIIFEMLSNKYWINLNILVANMQKQALEKKFLKGKEPDMEISSFLYIQYQMSHTLKLISAYFWGVRLEMDWIIVLFN